MDAGGTVPRTEPVEPSQEQRPRATHGAVTDDCMDAGGTVPWTEPVEPSQEQRPRATHGAVADDCMDAGDRATHGAVAENAVEPAAPPESTTLATLKGAGRHIDQPSHHQERYEHKNTILCYCKT